MSEVLGILFAVIVASMFIPKVTEYVQINQENVQATNTAEQQKKVILAGTKYIEQNAVAIQAAATATTPAVITVSMLQAPTVNLLDPAFSATNPYGQTWEIQVLEPTAGNLRAMVLSKGGTALKDKQASKIAALVGSQGGLIPTNDSGIYAGGSANAYGSFAGWTIPTAGFTSITGGQLAALISFNNGQLTNNYLYRNAIPGQPQLNQMSTALDMTNNSISNVSKASVGTVELETVVVEGAACPKDGTIARNAAGLTLSCQYGVFKAATATPTLPPGYGFGMVQYSGMNVQCLSIVNPYTGQNWGGPCWSTYDGGN